MSFLQVNHVCHSYFSPQTMTEALQHIQLTVKEGEFVSFIGPSGCGKTTLLSIIANIFPPTSGTVTLEGVNISTLDELTFGYMLQQDYLFPWKTITENVLLGLKVTKQYGELSAEIARSLLKAVGLIGIENKYPRELSGGMRQRVALARTLAVNPKVLLLDEPFSALDYQSKLKLEDFVWQKLKEYKKTAILVTHDIGEAIAMSDRIFLFSARPGKLHRTFVVPLDIRMLSPFEARNSKAYSELFHMIWKELEQLEQSTPL